MPTSSSKLEESKQLNYSQSRLSVLQARLKDILDSIYVDARRPEVTETTTNKSYGDTWRSRLSAMRNIPPVMRMVWECGPKTVVWSMALRVALALTPVAILKVSRWLVNEVVLSLRTPHRSSSSFLVDRRPGVWACLLWQLSSPVLWDFATPCWAISTCSTSAFA